jgi:hypothetical protein
VWFRDRVTDRQRVEQSAHRLQDAWQEEDAALIGR